MNPTDWARLPGMVAIVLSGTLAGCATATPKAARDATSMSGAAGAAPQAAVAGSPQELQARIDALEAKLGMMNEKLDVVVLRAEPALGRSAKQASETIVPNPADQWGDLRQATPASAGLDRGYAAGPAVSDYRQAMVNYRASRFAEAAEGFSNFVEKHPDHPLAGAAQYHLGECWLQRGDWKKGAEALERVLTSYDRSSHVSWTLKRLAEAEDHLGKSDQAARHRLLLTSLYPSSPAAQGVGLEQARSESTDDDSHQAATPVGNDPGAVDAPPPTLPAQAGG